MHKRRWTHRPPIFKQSSQPSALGVTLRISEKCSQRSISRFFLFYQFYFGWMVFSNRFFQRNEAAVCVAPGPVLAIFERGHQWMTLSVEVFRRVFVSGRIATSDMSARQTK